MAAKREIPVIDVSTNGDERCPVTRAVAYDLVEAAIHHGFIYLKSTGADIPLSMIDEAFSLSSKLFSAPMAEKMSCKIQENNRGYAAPQDERLDPENQAVGDPKEAFNFGEFDENGKAQQPLPLCIAPQESQINAFQDACHRLCLKLNKLLGIGLEATPTTFFTSAHQRSAGPSASILRLLHYLPGPPSSIPRAGAHTDYGSITLLFRLRGPGQDGLEILSAAAVDGQDGGGPAETWTPVPIDPAGTANDTAPPILVNIGDLLSFWTSGLLRSTMHRVVAQSSAVAAETTSGSEILPSRWSIAYFCHPVGSTPLAPVPSKRVQEYCHMCELQAKGNGENAVAVGTPSAMVITASEHVLMRLKASFTKLYSGEN